MTEHPPVSPGLRAYWDAIDEAQDLQDRRIAAAKDSYSESVQRARTAYRAYQDQQAERIREARDHAGQKAGQ